MIHIKFSANSFELEDHTGQLSNYSVSIADEPVAELIWRLLSWCIWNPLLVPPPLFLFSQFLPTLTCLLSQLRPTHFVDASMNQFPLPSCAFPASTLPIPTLDKFGSLPRPLVHYRAGKVFWKKVLKTRAAVLYEGTIRRMRKENLRLYELLWKTHSLRNVKSKTGEKVKC